MKKIILTGCSGFIGYHLTKKLLDDGHKVFGIDSNDSYYSKDLKLSRLDKLKKYGRFRFLNQDVSKLNLNLIDFDADIFIHLAAQAGVRYSLENPKKYVVSNINGFHNALDFCRLNDIRFIYASSSSVYGESKDSDQESSHSIKQNSFYALTKKIDEDMAEIYSLNYGFNSIGLRFFTVYGPWGRPDMSYWRFTESLFNDEPIEIYGDLRTSRDFTYISDVVNCVVKLIEISISTNEIFNITSGQNRSLKEMINLLQNLTGKKANVILKERHIGDVEKISASNSKINSTINFKPEVSLENGLDQFVRWYKRYYNV